MLDKDLEKSLKKDGSAQDMKKGYKIVELLKQILKYEYVTTGQRLVCTVLVRNKINNHE